MFNKRIAVLMFSLCWAFVSVVWAAGGPPNVSSDLEKLGMKLYNDKDLSLYGNQSCRNCHHHLSGFADITNFINPETYFVSTGSDEVSKGGRNAPSSAYAGFSPPLHEDSEGYVGGLFWDGRADGSVLGDPLAEQAQGPPLNPVEMAMPSKEAIIAVIKDSEYSGLWYTVFGDESLESSVADEAYDNFGRAIAAYERSKDVTKFSSKFDKGVTLSDAEADGRYLFVSKCISCHPIDAGEDLPGPLFTNYRYANIGVPENPALQLPEPDPGLGAIVGEDAENGKFKIPTLRNIARTAPYSHNGYFSTLTEMLEFINDRSGFESQYPDTVTDAVGSLGLSLTDLENLEAFLNTLTDE